MSNSRKELEEKAWNEFYEYCLKDSNVEDWTVLDKANFRVTFRRGYIAAWNTIVDLLTEAKSS